MIPPKSDYRIIFITKVYYHYTIFMFDLFPFIHISGLGTLLSTLGALDALHVNVISSDAQFSLYVFPILIFRSHSVYMQVNLYALHVTRNKKN